ncbi:MAG: MBOAT family protein [Verrucomicrobiota bacterium]
MLFNSYEFIVLFLPLTVVGYYLLGRFSEPVNARRWLIAASLFYYGWWNPIYLVLILGSAGFNYWLGEILGRWTTARNPHTPLLCLGILVNLILLGYFKYANFFVDSMNHWLTVDWTLEKIILPLAISFFTFQQIAYLIDVYSDRGQSYEFGDYLLFVVFFPQLIAGPIVHHQEMMPQFQRRRTYILDWENIAVGLTLFSFGLFKKVIIADTFGVRATEAFDVAAAGGALYTWEAWAGALAYTLQIYFDFSGYTDMAIGLGRMFGIRLPQNFNSPYKSVDIGEFWRRWHMTLSRFLRDYLYIPLGGNQLGKVRRDINLMITMVLGGLWHGAGWTFVLWGALHGAYLLINRRFSEWRNPEGKPTKPMGRLGKFVCVLITFFCVVMAWVLFRAANLDAAINMYEAMFGLQTSTEHVRLFKPQIFAFAGLALIFCWLAPNLQEFMARFHQPPGADGRLEIVPSKIAWNPTVLWALVAGVIFLSAFISLSGNSEFLYYQF